jgi:hypothetical protein
MSAKSSVERHEPQTAAARCGVTGGIADRKTRMIEIIMHWVVFVSCLMPWGIIYIVSMLTVSAAEAQWPNEPAGWTVIVDLGGAERAMREATLFVGAPPLISRRLEIRTIPAVPHEKAVLPTEPKVAIELRSGSLETVIDGVRQRRRPGEMWLLAQGARVTLNVLGEDAVLRMIYPIRESR